MREILFRGKRIDNGEWVLSGNIISFIPENGEDLIFIPSLSEPCICDHDENDNIIAFEKGMFYKVDTKTVGQYTGLNDKNGVNIFEGDIVDLFGMKGKVVQECGAFGIGFMKTIDYDLLESKIPFNNSANFCFNDNFISLWEVFWNYEQDDNPLYEVEVIGNITDNPELLEK